MDKADVDLARVATTRGECIECTIRVADPALIGRKASLVIEQRVTVKDSRPVNGSRRLLRRPLVLSSRETKLELDPDGFSAYTYRGEKIDVELHTILEVDDGILFDTKLTERQELELGWKPNVASDAANLIEPEDLFQFTANLAAIPFHRRVLTLALGFVGGIVVLANAAVGVHDQLVPEPATYFYSHVDSDGDGQSPILISLGTSGLVGAGIWALMRSQLRRYMRFRFRRLPESFQLGMSVTVGELIEGRSRVGLDNATLRIVACNMEKGQYKRGSGSKERIVSFAEPTRAVVLFEKTLPRVPPLVALSTLFPESMSFDPMFEALLPPQVVTKKHGLGIHWEVQLLHERFVDQELVGPTNGFAIKDFFFG